MKECIIYFLGVLVLIVLVLGITFGLVYLGNIKQCENYARVNPEREFSLVRGHCAVWYKGDWTYVEEFDNPLPYKLPEW